MKEIKLTRGQVAMVDDEDYEMISRHRWYSNKAGDNWYAHRQYRDNGKQVLVLMHRLITDAPKGKNVDHIDGNGLNNQKKNLRLCSHTQNLWNQRKRNKGYKGVTRHPNSDKWAVHITHHHETIYLGCFTCQEAAARNYDKLAKILYGEFACLNFPEKKSLTDRRPSL